MTNPMTKAKPATEKLMMAISQNLRLKGKSLATDM
jgi:hypothetical protein